MEYNVLKEILTSKIEAGNDVALPFIRSFGKPSWRAHDTVESVVAIVIAHPSATEEMVEAALQAFLDIGTEGHWTHSLSHFTGDLWGDNKEVKVRERFPEICVKWIKEFNRVAFGLANDGNTSCCDRLVNDFVQNARFDEDPADFHLTMDNLSWMERDEYTEFALARIDHGKFESAEALEKFRLLSSLRSCAKRLNLLPREVKVMIARLRKLGEDVSEFDNLPRILLEERIRRLEKEIVRIQGFDPNDWSEKDKKGRIQEIRKEIAKAKQELAKMA